MAMTTPTRNPPAAACVSACGADPEGELPKHIRDRVQDHPCYSEQAHRRFARMHVAVAPACNIQCHYCNRKYDCTNESRPGVVSELLTPEQAVRKALVVAAEIPQMSVVGIAGPGDPLANPDRTFETLRLISARLPNVRLCVSTNGLTLPEHADALADLGVEHVTVTINCTDPKVGARIYPWIFWNHRRVRGEKAAAILIARQLEGLDRLVARGVLVKVNSVMIPGINDQHLVEVSRAVRKQGAFLHNVMPLIARPEHGSYYGVTGQREPMPEELECLRDACGNGMRMMRHCRQCRADAVGLLGEDRSAEFTLERIDAMEAGGRAAAGCRPGSGTAGAGKQKPAAGLPNPVFVSLAPPMPKGNIQHHRPAIMAVASYGGELVDQHFGHAREFLIYEVTADDARLRERRPTESYCTGPQTCGDAEDALQASLRALRGCKAVLCARIGFEPWERLEAAGIRPDNRHAMAPIKAALMDVYRELADLDRTSVGAIRISA